MTKVVQHQADLFPILPSRYAHLQTKEVLGTVDQNMQDPLKSFLCFSNEDYSLVLRASELQSFLALPLQTLHRPPRGTPVSMILCSTCKGLHNLQMKVSEYWTQH